MQRCKWALPRQRPRASVHKQLLSHRGEPILSSKATVMLERLSRAASTSPHVHVRGARRAAPEGSTNAPRAPKRPRPGAAPSELGEAGHMEKPCDFKALLHCRVSSAILPFPGVQRPILPWAYRVLARCRAGLEPPGSRAQRASRSVGSAQHAPSTRQPIRLSRTNKLGCRNATSAESPPGPPK